MEVFLKAFSFYKLWLGTWIDLIIDMNCLFSPVHLGQLTCSLCCS